MKNLYAKFLNSVTPSGVPAGKRKIWGIVIAVIFGILLISFFVWWIKKKQEEKRIKGAKQGKNDKLNLDSEKEYDAIALDLYNVFDGFDSMSSKLRALKTLLALNDDEFIEVNNIFNRDYATDCTFCSKGETLKSWIIWETISAKTKKEVLDRFDKLTLA